MLTLFYNGQIYTGQPPLAQAMVVEDESFLMAGSMDGARQALRDKSGSVQSVDLKGAFVCPGFNDSHMHLLNYGRTLKMARLWEHTGSLEEMIAYMQDWVEGHGGRDSWVLGRGWNQDYFSGEKRFPSCRDLDRISQTVPVCLTRACGHCCVVNSEALRRLGITKETRSPQGGAIGHFKDGTPDGVFRENAMSLVYDAIGDPSLEDIKDALEAAMKEANRYGVTSCQTDDLATLDVPWTTVIAAFKSLEAEGRMTVRVNEQSQLTTQEALTAFLDAGWHTGAGDALFRTGPLKLISDGSLGARTAWLSAPYRDAPHTCGGPVLSPETMEELMTLAHSRKMQIAVHTIGDRALDQVLDIYGRLMDGASGNPLRHGIVHCQVTRPDQLKMLERLRLHIYAQTIFLDYDTQIIEDRVGQALAKSSYAFHSLRLGDCTVSNGSDAPVERPDVLAGIQCAVTRAGLNGLREPYRPEEAMTVWEAVDSYTSQGAFASFEEHVKGRIAPGFLADFVILEENPALVPGHTIGNIRVLETWMGGRRVYCAK